MNWHQLLCVSGVVHQLFCYRFVIASAVLLYIFLLAFLCVKASAKLHFVQVYGAEKGTETRHEMKKCKKTTLHLLCVFADVW